MPKDKEIIMFRRHGRSKYENQSSQLTGFLETSSNSAPSLQSFFGADLHAQPVVPPIHMTVLDPGSFLLLSALLQELSAKNEIERARLNLEIDKKREEQEAAKQAQIEDEKRFKEIHHALYK